MGFVGVFFLLLLLVKYINFRDSVFIVCLECPWCTTIKKFKSSKDGIYYRLTKVVCSPVLFTCFLPFWLWNRMTVSKISKLWLTDHRWVNADTDSNSIQWVTIHSQHNNLSLRYRKEKKAGPHCQLKMSLSSCFPRLTACRTVIIRFLLSEAWIGNLLTNCTVHKTPWGPVPLLACDSSSPKIKIKINVALNAERVLILALWLHPVQ